MTKEEQWYIDQYNRNREKKDWVRTIKELCHKREELKTSSKKNTKR
tara:strand:+ start:5845 stop:5982 length:138 start_codon:yes stop_codon:yes gene_type:complete